MIRIRNNWRAGAIIALSLAMIGLTGCALKLFEGCSSVAPGHLVVGHDMWNC
jgi:hypothetical protein